MVRNSAARGQLTSAKCCVELQTRRAKTAMFYSSRIGHFQSPSRFRTPPKYIDRLSAPRYAACSLKHVGRVQCASKIGKRSRAIKLI